MNNVRHRTGAGFAYQRGLYGFGIGIAVLDSGIYPHPDFNSPDNRIRVFRDFVNYRETPYDDNGHGTHIAGIISGNGYLSKGRYMGMAPKSHLIILKILDHHGNGTAETVCRAIEWTVRPSGPFPYTHYEYFYWCQSQPTHRRKPNADRCRRICMGSRINRRRRCRQ